MSPQQIETDRLTRLYELSMTLSGDPMDIFVHVARMIGELLDVKVVCLSEIRGAELHFLSVYVTGEIFVNAGHFHRAAAEVLRTSNAGNVDKALTLLAHGGTFEQLSNQLVQALIKCRDELVINQVKVR